MGDLGEREPIVPKEEVRAVIGARQELGEELEPQVIDGFVERIEKRIEQRIDERVRQRVPAHREKDKELALIIVSMAFSIPMLGIAAGTVGLPGVIAVCVALVLLNVLFRR